jgi:hypothetical protein
MFCSVCHVKAKDKVQKLSLKKNQQVTVTVLESISTASCICSLIRYHKVLEIELTARELFSCIAWHFKNKNKIKKYL